MSDPATLDGAGPPRALRGYFADAGLFPTYRTHVVLGRPLDRADMRDRAPPVVVLSNELWHSAFGADPHVIGRFVQLGGYRALIVGVAAAHVTEVDPWRDGLSRPDFWSPLQAWRWRDAGHLLRVVARAKPGMTQAAVDADLQRIFTTLAVAHPNDDAGLSAHVVPAHEEIVGNDQPFLITLAVAMLALLAIACANVGNLFLSRASARTGEFAVRFSLGATRRRIAAQLLTEVFLYVIAGGILGLGLTAFAIARLSYFRPASNLTSEIGIDPAVVGFTALIVVIAAVLAALAPIGGLAHPDVSVNLKASGRGADPSAGRRLRAALAAVEIALALALTTAAGLNLRSLQALAARPLGYDTAHLWLVSGDFYLKRYASRDGILGLYRRVRESVVRAPGVANASWTSLTPFYNTPDSTFSVAGRPFGGGSKPDTFVGPVDSSYFALYRIATLAGRTFDDSDRIGSEPTLVVNASFARRYLGGVAAALGKRVTEDISAYNEPQVPRTVVGVVADVRLRYTNLVEPIAYLPLAQVPLGAEDLVIRAKSAGVDVAKIVRAALEGADPMLPPPAIVTPYSQLLQENLSRQRTAVYTLGTSALIAFLLALAGIYAVVSFGAIRRTHEFGVRVSLGARPRDIALLVAADAGLILASGLAAGILLAGMAANFLAPQLEGVKPFDVPTFAVVIAALVVVVALATIVPVVRAMRVDPAVALRYE